MTAYDEVLVTYRYLRLAMVTVLVLLLAAVFVEWLHPGPSCWQDSLSGYYYTPAQAVLSASLLALGMGMIVLKGSTATEDLLRTWAGCWRRWSGWSRCRRSAPAGRRLSWPVTSPPTWPTT